MAGVGKDVPEELDIYEDLIENDDFEATDFIAEKLNNVETLKSENSELKGRLTDLESQIEVSKRQNDILKRNISKLYKTAKLEISRKDLLLSELQRRYDQLLFKRSKKNGEDLGQPNSSANQNPVVCKRKENGNISDFPSNQLTVKVGENRTNRLDLKIPNVINNSNNIRKRDTLKRDVVMDAKTCNDILGNINDAQRIFKMVRKASKGEKKIVNPDASKINLIVQDLSATDQNCSSRSNEVVAESEEFKLGSTLYSDALVRNEFFNNKQELLSVHNGDGSTSKERTSIKLTENHGRHRTADSKYRKVDQHAADRRKEVYDSKPRDIRRLPAKSSKPMSNVGEVKRKELNEREHFSAKKRSRSRSLSKSRFPNHGERGSRERNEVDGTRSRHSRPPNHLNNNSDYRTNSRDSSHRSSNAKQHRK